MGLSTLGLFNPCGTKRLFPIFLRKQFHYLSFGKCVIYSDQIMETYKVKPSLFKVRAGYGTSANFPGPHSYPICNLSFNTQYHQNQDGENVIINTSGAQLGNTNLKPERVDELELGIEASLWESRIGVDLSVYRRSTKDLIVTQPLDPATGYFFTSTNIGKIDNDGVEIDINSALLEKEGGFNWDLGINWSTIKHCCRFRSRYRTCSVCWI